MKLTGKQKDKIAGILFDSNGHSGGCTQIISYVNTILKQSDNSDYAKLIKPFKKIYEDKGYNISCECGYLHLHEGDNFCKDCGTRLDWSNFA